MNLIEIKEWRASLIASPHTLERIDALVGMVEELRDKVDWCSLRTAYECDSTKPCSECVAPLKEKYREKYGALE